MAPDVYWYFWSETLPNWLMALAALGAGIVFLWRKKERQEKAHEEKSSVLLAVQAKWVRIAGGGKDGRDLWGVVVENRLQAPILDVEVKTVGNNKSKTGKINARQLSAQTDHFFHSSGDAEQAWGFARRLHENDQHEEISSAKHAVQQITFTYRGNRYTHDGIGNDNFKPEGA